MANNVFANGREISCKKADGKSICAFPDVAMTPPENPATPPGVPVPYPNTGFAKDTTGGSKKVKITGKEIMLRNKSYYKTSTGDEAGCAAKKGIISSKIKGKVYYKSWSHDVKVEGKNVVRHLDMTTHNHASEVANESIPWPNIDTSAFGKLDSCKADKKAMEEACGDGKPETKCPGILSTPKGKQRAAHGTSLAAQKATTEAEGNECVKKSRCYLRPYKPNSSEDGCCPGQTGHHIPPKACFKKGKKYQKGYSSSKALCVCMEGMNQHAGSHGKNHAAIEYLADKKNISPGDSCDLKEYNSLCAATVAALTGCNKQCLENQLNSSLEGKNISEVNHVDTNSSAELSDSFKNDILASANQQSSIDR
jgi:hypothetical protein